MTRSTIMRRNRREGPRRARERFQGSNDERLLDPAGSHVRYRGRVSMSPVVHDNLALTALTQSDVDRPDDIFPGRTECHVIPLNLYFLHQRAQKACIPSSSQRKGGRSKEEKL